MILRPRTFQRRFLCTQISDHPHHSNHRCRWPIKQVTKTNFSEALAEFKTHIHDTDFVAVSLQKTGSYSSPWHRVLPVDTPDTAYFKAKYAAERFQVLQFAVCPFSVRASKVIAHPYNFHLFPRDEFKIGMPSYSFSCQSSYLTSMAREGFDFNACIYDGISYLSRSQESASIARIGNLVPSKCVLQSSSALSVADAVFVERIKSRVKHWINTIKDTGPKNEDALINSLRKLILGSEQHGSRPCLSIDVCSERQVQLVVEMLRDFSDDLVPLLSPAKGGGTQAVRVVLTGSKEDRETFERELENLEEEQNKRVRGFREVIDLISASQKPVVAHNSLNDFSFIYSNFLSSLPSSMDEFRSCLHLVFPHILDVSYLMKEIGPLRKVTNLPAAISFLKGRFFSPIDMEISHQADGNEGKIHGHNVLRISELFAKLCSILKISPETLKDDDSHLPLVLQGYANTFTPHSTNSQDPVDEDVSIWTDNPRKVECKDLVFLWGFRGGMSAKMLNKLLRDSHEVFSEEFDVRFLDRSCAVVVFWKSGSSETFLEAIDSGGKCCESLREMISEGLRAADYQIYRRACRLGLWKSDLADSLDKAVAECDSNSEADSTGPLEICWNNDLMINLDDL
ncbi:poly(A)-specific ribonuclease PARN-like isoform X2 [Rhododendron vialii]|uniref:poly(A)-specific ribonuclease PARN-like isoform X2 n=1 Tax=Rhododendron vialii TaxID=182163 RepID=UPI0026604E7B|nr:poly(A)-specific ribonuclease PARN-like isoform X2 [Rhododendron vialii]